MTVGQGDLPSKCPKPGSLVSLTVSRRWSALLSRYLNRTPVDFLCDFRIPGLPCDWPDRAETDPVQGHLVQIRSDLQARPRLQVPAEGKADGRHRAARPQVFAAVAPVPDLVQGLLDGSVELHLEDVHAVSDLDPVVGAGAVTGGVAETLAGREQVGVGLQHAVV